MKKKIMAKDVNEYLMEYAFALADVINDKEVPKKDKKWLRHKILCILEVQSVLDLVEEWDEFKGAKNFQECWEILKVVILRDHYKAKGIDKLEW